VSKSLGKGRRGATGTEKEKEGEGMRGGSNGIKGLLKNFLNISSGAATVLAIIALLQA